MLFSFFSQRNELERAQKWVMKKMMAVARSLDWLQIDEIRLLVITDVGGREPAGCKGEGCWTICYCDTKLRSIKR